jgi:hypothetical protein
VSSFVKMKTDFSHSYEVFTKQSAIRVRPVVSEPTCLMPLSVCCCCSLQWALRQQRQPQSPAEGKPVYQRVGYKPNAPKNFLAIQIKLQIGFGLPSNVTRVIHTRLVQLIWKWVPWGLGVAVSGIQGR